MGGQSTVLSGRGGLGFISAIMPMKRSDKDSLESVRDLFEPSELEELKSLLKSHKARFASEDFNTSDRFLEDSKYLSLACNVVDDTLRIRVEDLNKKIIDFGKQRIFQSFSQNAAKKIFSLVAPERAEVDAIKYAGIAQLFSKKQVHILFLGDLFVGKDKILKDLSALAPIMHFGSGKGVETAGLTFSSVKGEIVKGSLALADKGIAYIDELNLLQTTDRAALLGSMTNGVMESIKKGKNHIVEARTKIFASVTPEGEGFVGRNMGLIKKQIPLDSSVLNRFHLVFLARNREPSEDDEVSKIDANDRLFVREYVEYALKKTVEFDKALSPMIKGYINDVRQDEDYFLFKLDSDKIVAMIQLSRAFARMRLSDKVERRDIMMVLKIFNSALYMKNEFK